MANYYQDFVGLNTFIYEVVGWDPDQIQASGTSVEYYNFNGTAVTRTPYQNTFGHDFSINTLSYTDELIRTKNFLFSHKLPTTASYFPALMLHRNGPYGFPTWKQIRIGQNPLSRRQIKENILTIVQEPGSEFSYTRNGKVYTQRSKYGDILKFTETPIVSRFNPAVVFGQTITGEKTSKLIIRAPLGNNTVQFNNSELNEQLGLVNLKSDIYEKTKQLYLDRALFKNDSPLDVFELLLYKETIYPPQVHTYKNYVRQRTTFSFPWRDDRADRVPSAAVANGFGSDVRESVWTMDAYRGWDTAAVISTVRPKGQISGYVSNLALLYSEYVDNGILQNQYSSFSNLLATSATFPFLDSILRPAPIYNRKHVQTNISSSANINGMKIESVNSASATGTFFNNIHTSQLPAGEAKWEAGSQSGKNPFYDSYDNYIQGARQLGKEYSIIPEFRMSNNVSFYETSSPLAENLNVFELTGALSDTTGSNENNFYEIYSNSDFLKNFEMVVNDNKEIGEPLYITLTCKGVKKLLPYEGFYPQQRTVQIAKQFFDSYSGSMSVSGALNDFGEVAPIIGFQNVMAPLFAPGILFNSIKSGVAVDYPIIKNNLKLGAATNKAVLKEGDNYYCSFSGSLAVAGYEYSINDGLIFDQRVPFETIMKPEILQNLGRLYCNEPDLIANHSSSTTINATAGDRLYSLMMHNFLAETSNFFLQNKNYTTFFSKPSNELKQFEAGKDYMMRVKMYKTTDDPQVSAISGGVGDKYFASPQYSSTSNENFTMYSRPTAFGPPSLISSSMPFLTYSVGIGYIPQYDNDYYIGNRPHLGENYPFTPPYYHGQAWADITFTPVTDGNYSVKEIIAQASTSYYRYVHPETDTGENIFNIPHGSSKAWGIAYAENSYYNKNALQLSASINLNIEERDESGDLNEETSRWIIQSKWETPMLNFNHLSASDSVTLPINASQSVPRGMWHQYGQIEENQAKGVFLQVEDVDPNWLTNVLGKEAGNVQSLSDHLDFSTQPKRMGEVADSKVIREAIVAVPFIEEDGLRKYFHIPRSDIDNALTTQDASGQSVAAMINKMRNYVFPPNMDFLANTELDPFAMYIFEFTHTLDKQDLADIWQGLYPKVTSRFETVKSSISHPLLAQELLGGGASIVKTSRGGTGLDTGDQGNKLPSKTRWMVFKVKQRAKGNYWRTISGIGGDKLNEVPRNTFNWPYDFFSLVELAKIDTQVAIGEFQGGSVKRIVQPQGQTEKAEQIKKYSTSTMTAEAQASVSQPLGSTQMAQTTTKRVGSSNFGELTTADGFQASYDPTRTYSCEELKELVRTEGTGNFSTDHKLQHKQCI